MGASACRLRCRPRAFGSLAASVRCGVAMAHLLRGLAGVRDRAHGQPEFLTILLNYTFSPQYALSPACLPDTLREGICRAALSRSPCPTQCTPFPAQMISGSSGPRSFFL